VVDTLTHVHQTENERRCIIYCAILAASADAIPRITHHLYCGHDARSASPPWERWPSIVNSYPEPQRALVRAQRRRRCRVHLTEYCGLDCSARWGLGWVHHRGIFLLRGGALLRIVTTMQFLLVHLAKRV